MAWERPGRGGGMQIQPRPKLPDEHILNPRYEAILGASRGLDRQYRTRGENIIKDNVVFPGDPERQPIPVPQAAMILQQCGIPLSHPNYPPVKKFNTRHESWRHYIQYVQPIIWEKDENFRYIPTMTRYVMNRDGMIRNAYNGKEVETTSFMAELVRDGGGSPRSNETRRVPIQQLMMLTFGKLPKDFIDFGFGNYSHSLEFNPKTGVVEWVPLQEIYVRADGQTQKFKNLREYAECEVPPQERDALAEIRKLTWNKLTDQVYRVGPIEIKAVEPVVPLKPAETQGNGSESLSGQAETPKEEQAPAPKPEAKKEEDVFDASTDTFTEEEFDSGW